MPYCSWMYGFVFCLCQNLYAALIWCCLCVYIPSMSMCFPIWLLYAKLPIQHSSVAILVAIFPQVLQKFCVIYIKFLKIYHHIGILKLLSPKRLLLPWCFRSIFAFLLCFAFSRKQARTHTHTNTIRSYSVRVWSTENSTRRLRFGHYSFRNVLYLLA